MESQMQMLFDAPKLQPPTAAVHAIKAGDILSVINKENLEHRFMKVVSTTEECIQAIERGSIQSGNVECFSSLAETKPLVLKNDNWVLVKTCDKNPKGEFVKAGLAKQHSQKMAIRSLKRLRKI